MSWEVKILSPQSARLLRKSDNFIHIRQCSAQKRGSQKPHVAGSSAPKAGKSCAPSFISPVLRRITRAPASVTALRHPAQTLATPAS
ncbi:hypothetical protein ACXYUI_28020, partial [Klebsiella pneumoniae]